MFIKVKSLNRDGTPINVVIINLQHIVSIAAFTDTSRDYRIAFKGYVIDFSGGENSYIRVDQEDANRIFQIIGISL